MVIGIETGIGHCGHWTLFFLNYAILIFWGVFINHSPELPGSYLFFAGFWVGFWFFLDILSSVWFLMGFGILGLSKCILGFWYFASIFNYYFGFSF